MVTFLPTAQVMKSSNNRVSPLSVLCRRWSNFVAIVPLILLLLFLVLVFNKYQDERQGYVTNSENQWESYLSRVLNNNLQWNEEESNDQEETAECNYQDYIMGQPVEQDDPCLIATFKKKLLIPPPPLHEQNHDEPNITGEMPSNIEKFRWIEKLLLENSPNQQGFFIECGANDGEFISPTIRLEKKYNWTGLLIEANPQPFQLLLQKKRNAYAVNAAACITPHPQPITFYTKPTETGVSGINRNDKKGVTVNITVQCIPMYTMLSAINVKMIDYFSLDVEGLELEILKTLPWDKIEAKVLTVEYIHIPGKEQALIDFMTPKGYIFIKKILDSLTVDALFVHQSLYEKAMRINKEKQ